jgi:hypothetical protein
MTRNEEEEEGPLRINKIHPTRNPVGQAKKPKMNGWMDPETLTVYI